MRCKQWLGIIAASLLLAVPTAGHAAETIKLGVGGSFSGDLAGYGLPELNAAKLVVDKINAKGGINGKMVEGVSSWTDLEPELRAAGA